MPEGYSVKWYRVITTRKDAGSPLGFVPDELQFITSEPSFRYAVTGKSFKTLQDQYAANPDYQMADGEYNWIVCSVFCHRTQDERVFRKGWNYVSFNDRSLDLTSFMTSCGSALTGIRGDNGIYMFDSNTGWTGTPIELSIGKSYDVYFSRECTYRRLNAIRSMADETNIVLNEGWSRIGYTPAEELTIDEALKDYTPTQNDVIKDYVRHLLRLLQLGNRRSGNRPYVERKPLLRCLLRHRPELYDARAYDQGIYHHEHGAI